MALSPAITAANGQTEPLRQAQLVLSGSVMSTVAVRLPPHQCVRATRGKDMFLLMCALLLLLSALLRRALEIALASTPCLSSQIYKIGSSCLHANRHVPCAIKFAWMAEPDCPCHLLASLPHACPGLTSHHARISHVLGRRRAHTANL